MTRFKKIFIFLLTIAFIGSAIYIYSSFKTVKAYTFTVPNISLQKINDKIKDTIKSAKSSTISFAEKKAEDTAKKSSRKIKQNTFEFIKKNINSGIDVIGEAIGVDISAGGNLNNNQSAQQQNCKI